MQPVFDENILACAQRLEQGDPVRFRAVMAAPAHLRPRLFTLFAFNIEVARAPWVTSEEMIAEMRLQWWYDALGEIAAIADIRRHEIVTPLSEQLTPAQAQELQRLVEARRWDIYRDPFESEDAFEKYIHATSGTLLRVAGAAEDAVTQARLSELGYANGVANFLVAVPELVARGRTPFAVETDRVFESAVSKALAACDRALATRSEFPEMARYAALSTYQTQYILKCAARSPNAVTQGALQPSWLSDRLVLMKQRLLNPFR